MSFTLLEELNIISNKIDTLARNITESLAIYDVPTELVESADVVLGTLAAKLKNGTLQGPEVDEYAQLYAALAMLADPDVQAGFNIDTNTPVGKQKMANVINRTGEVAQTTANVKRVATTNGQAKYQETLNALKNFGKLDPQKQQAYINDINRLRISYERQKNDLNTALGGQQTAPAATPAPAQSV